MPHYEDYVIPDDCNDTTVIWNKFVGLSFLIKVILNCVPQICRILEDNLKTEDKHKNEEEEDPKKMKKA